MKPNDPEPEPLTVAEQVAERRRQARALYVRARPEVEPEFEEPKP